MNVHTPRCTTCIPSIIIAAILWHAWQSANKNYVVPLTRAQKIGLWSGVAVLIAYLMADDGEADD